jgi:hypothetical protein
MSDKAMVMMTNVDVLSNFTNKPLEGKLSDKQLRRFLITPNFAEDCGARTESMGFLDSSSSGL